MKRKGNLKASIALQKAVIAKRSLRENLINEGNSSDRLLRCFQMVAKQADMARPGRGLAFTDAATATLKRAEALRLGKPLSALVQAIPWFMRALAAARDLGLPSWCIGAGAIRSMVWDHLHGFDVPSALVDIDVVYFDAGDLRGETDQARQAQLAQSHQDMDWDVANQAAVHLWFESAFGHPVDPLNSLDEAVASWPEFATCVGIRLTGESDLQVIAPLGLHDLFAMVIRRNPARVSPETYRRRLSEKRYAQRWPKVIVIE